MKQVIKLLFLTLTGCASMTQQQVVHEVHDAVESRSGLRPIVRGADVEVEAKIAEYLEGQLTIEEALRIALINNQELLAAYEEIGVARADLVDAGLLRNPVFDAELRFEGGGGIGTGTSLSLVQEVVSLLQLPMKKKVSALALEAAKLELTAETLETIYETEKAFYAYQGAAQALALRQQIVDSLAAAAEVSRRQWKAGNISPAQYLSETALYAAAQRDLVAAEAEVHEQREELNVLLGLWGKDTNWDIEPRLPEIACALVETGGLETLAVRRRPELEQIRFEVDALAAQLGLTESFRLLPDLEVGVEVEGEDHGEVVTGPSLSLPIPIFNQGQADVARARAHLEAAKRRYAARAVRIRAEVRQALSRLMRAHVQARFDRDEFLPLMEKLLSQSQREYNGMVIGVYDLLRVKREGIEAGVGHIEALRDYWVARAELKRAVGGNLVDHDKGRCLESSLIKPSEGKDGKA